MSTPRTESKTSAPAPDIDWSKLRVLVADDDEGMLHGVASAIAQLGAKVTTAATGAELIEHLGETTFDLIVTDVSMPWMSGLQAMHSARTAGLATPVVVMTALREPRIAEQTQSLGDSAFLLRKPFDSNALYVALGTVMRATRRPA